MTGILPVIPPRAAGGAGGDGRRWKAHATRSAGGGRCLCGALLAPCGGSAQSTTSGKPPVNPQSNTSDGGAQATTGMKIGGTHAVIYDQQLRPITAGGFVKNGPLIFKDIARQAGLTSLAP